MKAKELDNKFDEGEDIIKYLDVSKAHRPKQEQKESECRFPSMDNSSVGQRGKTARSAATVYN